MSLPVERDARGRFPAGKSGNPAGRPKGSKNRITQLKLELEQSLREDPIVQEKVRNIFMQMLDMAEAGNEKMIRLVMEKFISGAAIDEVKHEGTQEYVFKVVRADPIPTIPSEVTDAEVIEVKEND